MLDLDSKQTLIEALEMGETSQWRKMWNASSKKCSIDDRIDLCCYAASAGSYRFFNDLWATHSTFDDGKTTQPFFRVAMHAAMGGDDHIFRDVFTKYGQFFDKFEQLEIARIMVEGKNAKNLEIFLDTIEDMHMLHEHDVRELSKLYATESKGMWKVLVDRYHMY